MEDKSSFIHDIRGDTAIVIGGGEGIARALLPRFRQVIAADPARSLVGGPVLKLLKEREVRYAFGRDATPDQLPADCDLVLFAFSLANYDDPAGLIQQWASRLRDNGKVVVLEWYGGPQETPPEMELHALLLARLEQAGSLRRSTSRDLVKLLRSAGLHHVRSTIEDGGGLFTSEDLAFLSAEGLSRLVKLGEGDSKLAKRLRGETLEPGQVLIAYGLHKLPLSVEQLRTAVDKDAARALVESSTAPASRKELVDLLVTVLDDDVDDPEATARHLLQTFGAKALATLDRVEMLREAADLPVSTARRLLDTLELGRRLFTDLPHEQAVIHGPEDAWEYLKPQMAHLKREHFRGLYLNVKHRVEADEVISIGSLTASIVHPREVFSPAIEYKCHSVLVAHNHPSGDPEPSFEDIHITRELAEAGRLLGIELLDHIIIGKERYISMKERGHI